MTGREKCEPGCTCGKHSGQPRERARCEPGCTCGRHRRTSVIDWNDPDARKAYNRKKAAESYAASPESYRAASKRWRERNPGRRGRMRDEKAELKWRYGITPDQWQEFFDTQNGLCYLCDEPLNIETRHGINVDHDHSCCRGKRSCGSCIRGLACHPCNTGIGAFGDDPDRMRRVADNLELANRRVRNIPEVSGRPSSVPAGDESRWLSRQAGQRRPRPTS